MRKTETQLRIMCSSGELFAAIKEVVPPAEMEVAVFSDDKQTREENIRQVTEKLKEAFAEIELQTGYSIA